MCAYIGRIEIAEILLDAGADPNMLDECKKVFFSSIFNWAPIHYAAYLNDIPFVQLLLKKGGQVDCRGGLGETALHIAITNNLTEMARVLIDLGADVNAQNSIKKVFFYFLIQLHYL